MIPENLAIFSSNELENRAEIDLRSRPDIDFSIPINIEVLIENLPNVSLNLREGLSAKHKVAGMVRKSAGNDKGLEVLIDVQVYSGPWHAYNAALAEEYSHIKIHPSLFLCVTNEEDFLRLQADPQWARHEHDARRYSDAIRMPRELLAHEAEYLYPRLVSEHGFGDTITFMTLMRSKLASRFRVTSEDMRRRLQHPQVDLEQRLLNSLQARELQLLPATWSIVARRPCTQMPLFEQEPWE